MICYNCGRVVEEKCIDDSREWRSFSDSGGSSGGDRNRVGAVSNDLLHGQGLGTSIGGFGSSGLARTHMITTGATDTASDRALSKCYTSLRNICESLEFPENILLRSCELVRNLDTASKLKNKTGEAWMITIVYAACRLEGAGRSVSELLPAASPAVTEKDVAKKFWWLKKQGPEIIPVSTTADGGGGGGSTIGPDTYLPRFCGRLNVVKCERLAMHLAMEVRR
jgi:transcription initiation factor TFIIB